MPTTDASTPTDPDDEPIVLTGRARLGAQRRAGIVDAAIDIFAVRGFRVVRSPKSRSGRA